MEATDTLHCRPVMCIALEAASTSTSPKKFRDACEVFGIRPNDLLPRVNIISEDIVHALGHFVCLVRGFLLASTVG